MFDLHLHHILGFSIQMTVHFSKFWGSLWGSLGFWGDLFETMYN